MMRRNYNEEDMDLYLAGGFVPRIVATSFESTGSSLGTTHEPSRALGWGASRHSHPTSFRETLDDQDECRKLEGPNPPYIRAPPRQRTEVILYHESQTKALWDRMSTLAEKMSNTGSHRGGSVGGGGNGGGGGDNKRTPTCSHCKSSELHEALKVGIGKADCPLLSLGGKEARKASKEIMTEAKATQDADVSVIVAGKLSAGGD
mmetsp:Transcript_11680/g.17954  ORF Transcript_11680/g.17954 Transcript_11680/m.17954 type:complete len:204 (-) Transcript_11680:51-662(-)